MSESSDVDPPLEPGAVLALARRYAPSAQRLTEVDESGRKGRAYLIDDDIVLKTHRPQRLRARAVEEFETSLEKEAFFLEQLALADLPAPRLLGHGHEGGVEYICMSRVPGANMRRLPLSPPGRASVLRELGGILRRIHGMPVAAFVTSGLFPNDGSPAELRTRLEALFARLAEKLCELPGDERTRIAPDQIAAAAIAALPDSTDRAVLHSNPAGEHVFVHPATAAVTGLIDYGDAYISHPAFDLRSWTEPEDRAALVTGYSERGAVDSDFLSTVCVGQLVRELGTVLRRQQPPQRSDAIIDRLLAELG